MPEPTSPIDVVKRNGLYMFAGIIVCGVAGTFIGGSDARALGGGIGAGLGMLIGLIVERFRN